VISLNSTDDDSENESVLHNPHIRRKCHSPSPSSEAEDSTSLSAPLSASPFVEEGGSVINPPPASDDGSTDVQSSPLASDSEAREEVVSSDSKFRLEDAGEVDDAAAAVEEDISKMQDTVDGVETWEDELDMRLGLGMEVKGWDLLREQIQARLKKNYKQYSLSQINQYMLLSNFANLRLKGHSRIDASLEIARQWHTGTGNWFARRIWALARHYQIFENLPIEKRGGFRSARSFLHDESVHRDTLAFLNTLPAGKITPRALAAQVNSNILPECGIQPSRPISNWTAQRWLIRLGW
jgi:hypothetical protein